MLLIHSMLSVICICALFHGAVSLSVHAPNDKPSVAIMVVGAIYKPKHATRVAEEHATTNMIERMTGEYEDGYAEGLERVSDSNGWENIVQNLLEPAKRTHSVDLYVCTNRAEGEVPPEVSQVIVIESSRDQEDHGALCVSQIRSSGRTYEWFIKTRPDFVFYQEFPPITSFSQGYVYTRFRSIQGIGGLTSDHFSWDYCEFACNGIPATSIGYVNDDMVRVVPGALMDFAFRHENASWERVPHTNFTDKNWITMPGPGWVEDQLTRFWLDRKIFTMPLACPGYPSQSKRSHRRRSEPCSGKDGAPRVRKEYCGAMASIKTAHRAFM